MTHRTQITLEDEQYARLMAHSAESGRSLAELIRRAVDVVYPEVTIELRRQALADSFGAWRDRDQDGADYVESLRPGLGHKLEGL